MSNEVTAVEIVGRSRPYRVPRAPTPIDLYLDGNEGASPSDAVLDALSGLDAEALRRYPSTAELEAILAANVGVEPSQLIVTAGADDAIDRICRAVLGPGRNAVIPVPTFEMVPRFAEMTGAEVRRVPGGQSVFPVDEVLDSVDDDTALIVAISPNNPTGVVASPDELHRLATNCPGSLLLVDHAYVEFADDDMTEQAVDYPNMVVTRTLSKAWGLAGLRVGYAVAQEPIIKWLKTAGNPYPVSKPSLLLAERWLDVGEQAVSKFIDRIVEERRYLQGVLSEVGASPMPSQANFVFARVGDGLWWRDALAGQGIGVRAFPERAGLQDAVRIACPGSDENLRRVERAVRTVATPEALLFDLDGVFADVSQSYRQAVIGTAGTYGVQVTEEQISAAKARGNANNDWRVTRELLADHGVSTELDEVTERFEKLYQGTDEEPGLWAEEELLVDLDFFEKLADLGLPMGVVTGRPRRDAERFLEHWKIGDYFDALVCMEDAPIKPDPAPVRLAMQRLGIERAWFVGDTPDDMRAGRAARVLPLGIVAPEEDERRMKSALLSAGGGRVLESLEELFEVL